MNYPFFLFFIVFVDFVVIVFKIKSAAGGTDRNEAVVPGEGALTQIVNVNAEQQAPAGQESKDAGRGKRPFNPWPQY